jgi:stage III sporulation protein AD
MGGLMFKLCGLAITAAMLIALLRKWNAELAVFLKIAAGIVAATACIGAAMPIVEYVRELAELGAQGEILTAAELMLRVLAVATVTYICANICRDCGETTLASYLELGGKIEIVLLSLPLIKEIVSLSVGMM